MSVVDEVLKASEDYAGSFTLGQSGGSFTT
jgi:hypothetical protein